MNDSAHGRDGRLLPIITIHERRNVKDVRYLLEPTTREEMASRQHGTTTHVKNSAVPCAINKCTSLI